MSQKTRELTLPGGEKVWRYAQPFSHNTGIG